MRTSKVIVVDEKDREHLGQVIRNGNTPQKVALRARIVLLSADGVSTGDMMQQLSTSTPTISRWRRRYETDVDNYATHSHPEVSTWLVKHPRFHMHFTPTSASWLNLVERWFREITEKRIRCGVFRNVPSLVTAIMEYLEATNADPKPLAWTASVQTILSKVRRANEVLETLH